MSMAFMDSMSMVTVQTLGLQQMRREAAIESAPKALLPVKATADLDYFENMQK